MTKKILLVGLLLVVGCGGVEGTYALDKADTKKANEAAVAKLPADQQEAQKTQATMLDTVMASATIELKAGGVASMKTTMSMQGKESVKEDSGTWKKDGDAVLVTSGGKDTKCEKSGKKLTCSDAKGPGTLSLVFVKS
jgi:hypothetical protein